MSAACRRRAPGGFYVSHIPDVVCVPDSKETLTEDSLCMIQLCCQLRAVNMVHLLGGTFLFRSQAATHLKPLAL